MPEEDVQDQPQWEQPFVLGRVKGLVVPIDPK